MDKKSVEYRTWHNMHQRCYNRNNPNYRNYGARDIKVCDRWRDFKNFMKDMGKRPESLSIDRINNDGNYEPDNCRWATVKQQMKNKSYGEREDTEGQINHDEYIKTNPNAPTHKTLIQFYADDEQMDRIKYIMDRYKKDSAIDSRAVAINKTIATIYNQLKDEDNGD